MIDRLIACTFNRSCDGLRSFTWVDQISPYTARYRVHIKSPVVGLHRGSSSREAARAESPLTERWLLEDYTTRYER